MQNKCSYINQHLKKNPKLIKENSIPPCSVGPLAGVHTENFNLTYNISHKLLRQVNSWKNLWKFSNGSLCRNKSDPSPLLNVAAYWKSSNTKASVKSLSQILANNIDNGGRGIGLEFTWDIVGGILAKSSEIPLRRAGSLLIWINYFNRSFLKKVRSHY